MNWLEVCISRSHTFSLRQIQNVTLAQKRLRDLKARISTQSKKNFILERDVRYLDQRIALLIQNRMALDEVPLFPCTFYCPMFIPIVAT